MRGSEYAELRAFAAIAEHGSFVRAAAHLGMTPSALSQTMRRLEERLGVRLLNRTTRSVAPTEAGAKFLARLLPIMADLDTAVADVGSFRDTPAGRVRINTSRVAALHYLAPLIALFHRLYPEIQLDLVVDDRLVDIVAGGFDAGVRLGETLEQDMVAVRLSKDLEMMMVAAPAYIERFGMPQTPRELQGHHCINTRWPTDESLYRWELERNGRELEVSVDGPLVVTDPDVAIRAVLDGVGIGFLFDDQVRSYVEAGRMVRLLDDWSPSFPGFYLYYPSRRQLPLPMRVFVDFLKTNAPAQTV